MSQDNSVIARLRARLSSDRPAIATAHNPLTAKLAAEAGFDTIWAVASNYPPPTRCRTPTSCRWTLIWT